MVGKGLTWAEHQEYIQDVLDAYTAKGTLPPPPQTDVLYVVPVKSVGGRGISRSITFATQANTRQGEYVAKKTDSWNGRISDLGTEKLDCIGSRNWTHHVLGRPLPI